MNWKKYQSLLIGGGILLALIIAATVFLFKLKGGYEKTQGLLETKLNQVSQLNSKKPFPSPENARKIQEQVEELENIFGKKLNEKLDDQIEEVPVSGDDFIPYLRDLIQSISSRNPKVSVIANATEKEPSEIEGEPAEEPSENEASLTRVAQNFDFGFPVYLDLGTPPPTNYIPRLTVQLQTVREVCNVLYDAGISELVEVTREEFETGSGRKSRRMGYSEGELRSGRPDTSEGMEGELAAEDESLGLYTTEKLEVVFQADEGAVWEALSLLANAKAPIQVTKLYVENQNVDIKPEFAKAATSTSSSRRSRGSLRSAGGSRGSIRPPEKESEVVDINALTAARAAGNELIEVRLHLTVYRFNRAQTDENNGEG
jgi:hypothetical protein